MSERSLLSDLRAARAARGWSQAELAQRAGVSRAEVSAIETGRLGSPSAVAALALARACGLPVEELFRLAEPGAREAPAWAWPPESADARFWQAQVGARALRYPLERTLLGTLPHDGLGESAAADAGTSTLVIAGCDPAVGLLAAALGARGVRVLALTRSSRRALELLAAGQVHLAGVHLGNNRRAARSLLRGQAPLLIHLARWEAGLALAPARRVRSVRAALRERLRWVGREEGSGAHRLVERALASEGAPRPRGLERVARDHVGVAETVRSGWAEVGPCLRLSAEEAGLDFLGIERQAYELCTTAALRDEPPLRAALEVLASSSFRRRLGELPGYDARETGRVVEVA